MPLILTGMARNWWEWFEKCKIINLQCQTVRFKTCQLIDVIESTVWQFNSTIEHFRNNNHCTSESRVFLFCVANTNAIRLAPHQNLCIKNQAINVQCKSMHVERFRPKHSNWTVASCADSHSNENSFISLIFVYNFQRLNDMALAHLNPALVWWLIPSVSDWNENFFYFTRLRSNCLFNIKPKLIPCRFHYLYETIRMKNKLYLKITCSMLNRLFHNFKLISKLR